MQNISLSWQNAVFKLSEKLSVSIPALSLNSHDLIVLIGSNGCGKTSVARALAGELPLLEGTAPQHFNAALVSFEKQQKLFEDDYNLRNTDAASEQEERGYTPRDLLKDSDPKILWEVIKAFNLANLLDRPVRLLSGGEGRKILIAQCLCTSPDLLILDAPFDALDVKSRQNLLEIISYIHENYEIPIVLIVNRPDEIPANLSMMGIIQDLKIIKIDKKEIIEKDEDAKALLFCGNLPDITLPKAPAKFRLLPLNPGPLVELKNVNITYNRPIFKDLNFTVMPHEHWQISGPNGAGKSTLLSLITGDNPLVYTNDVTVFGFKRGSGESIWDIKKYFGVVSGALHLDYRVSAPLINVVLSGFYDSIGLYNRPGDEEINCAKAWLKLIGLEHKEQMSFKQLSFGQQRILLIVRALVKNPPLLILDEPLQGLDSYARAMVRSFISYFMHHGDTSILFVSHHAEDAPEGITNKLTFVPVGDNNYEIVQEKIKD